MNTNVKNVILHVCLVFGSVIGSTLAATGYSTSKAAIIAGVSTAATATLHYLSGLIPSSSSKVTAPAKPVAVVTPVNPPVA